VARHTGKKLLLNLAIAGFFYVPITNNPKIQYNEIMEMFDGKKQAMELDAETRAWLTKHQVKGKLAIILIGSNPASKKFTALKKKLCDGFNIPAEIIEISDNLTDTQILERAGEVCHNPEVTGVIIQLPTPRESLRSVLDLIPYDKDVDQLCPTSQKKFYDDDFKKLPPVVRALQNFLSYAHLDIKNLKVNIIGKGFLVGSPLGHYLSSEGAKV
jgi:methylenetetrahydrofolate dehydrogenase (NADP+) / methenyltetrahydrofolate cyclohydrolase